MEMGAIPFTPLPQPWQINATSVRKSSPGEGQQQLVQKGITTEIRMQNTACPAQGRWEMFSEREMRQKKKTQSVSCPHDKFFFSPRESLTPFPWGMMCNSIKKQKTPHPSARSDQTKPLFCLCRFCPGAEELTSSIINFTFQFFESANKDCKQ